MLVHFPLMSRMVMVVRTVLTRMGMLVHFPLAPVNVRVFMLVNMLVRVDMRMLVPMRYVAVRMLVAVHMRMLVAVKMGMLMFSFHICYLQG
jgi:hypothetical protein